MHRLEELRKSIAHPSFLTSAGEVKGTCSFGFAFSEAGPADPDKLIRFAHEALYRAKGRGRNAVERFIEELHVDLQHEIGAPDPFVRVRMTGCREHPLNAFRLSSIRIQKKVGRPDDINLMPPMQDYIGIRSARANS
jgi:hypothetical protein